MSNQCWIRDSNQCLAAIVHNPKVNFGERAVILVAGYANTMCDVDYFMSKLAHKLSAVGLYVIQVDPIGHGDSFGQLSDVTIHTYKESIRIAIKYIQREFCNNIVCIGRGISASIQSDLAKELGIQKIVGINPYNICGNVIAEIWGNEPFEIKEISEVYQGKDYKSYSDFNQQKRYFFNALGGTILNLHGQCINGVFIKELMEYSPCLCGDASDYLWIWCDDEPRYSATCITVNTTEGLMKDHHNEGLRRKPTYQDSLISYIVNYIVKE